MAEKKIRLLLWADYACATGFANVAGNIMRELHKTGRYEIDVVGINYSGDPYDENKWPGHIYPAMPGILMQGPYADVYGRQRVLDRLGTGEYDVLFMIQDTFILRQMDFIDKIRSTQDALPKNGMKQFKTVFYYPIDAPTPKKWIEGVVDQIDYPVAYTNYAKGETLKHVPELEKKLNVIYHGNNFDNFHYIEDREKVAEFREKYFGGKADNKFLILNVNRNQPRKHPLGNLLLMRELMDRGMDDFAMYLHMQHDDAGGNIFAMADQMGITDEHLLMPTPDLFNANQGISFEMLNLIYNSADALFSPTLGEGWGLSITEGMATKTPVIAPNCTSLIEMGADNRVMLVPAGADNNLWTAQQNDNNRVRPLMDIKAAADAIIKVRTGDGPDIDGALEWVKTLAWANIVEQWVPIVDAAAADAEKTEPVEGGEFMNRAQRRALKRGKK